MRNLVSLLVILAFIAVTALSGYPAIIQAEEDLCGGTNGNGEIVSVGNNAFILKLNNDGEKGGGNLTVNLTRQTTIETLAGTISLSQLKKGDRVTLVGDNHRDGTFTADAVVVCSATGKAEVQKKVSGRSNSIMVRNNDTSYKKVSGAIEVVTMLLVGLTWLGMSLFLKLKKRKSFVYLLFFTIFYIYMYKVLDYTLLQFQSLLLLKQFLPNLMLNGVPTGKSVNLIPLLTLKPEDIKTSLLNVLMMMPFGFGLPFITDFQFKKVVSAGLLLSIIIELLQLITGFMANTTFRVADVNDLLFNTIGVAIGYMLFVGFVRNYRLIVRNRKMVANPILRYIADRPQVDK